MMARNLRYEIILYWSNEDQAFIAEVPELPGCAADGSTYQEAVAHAEVVIREWIETARELGWPIPTRRGRLLYA
jgi:predicted RNase H-like HicB family nuclease